jgi:biopolymer transport protein ExbD
MNFRRVRREAPGVDLTPLIDVVFLLLIFFMVSTTFIRETRLQIDLPESSGVALERDDDPVEITVDSRGDYSVNNRLLLNNELPTLLRALQEATAGREPGALRVIITADAAATHQAVVRALDGAGQAGLVRISIATRQPAAQE